MKLAAHLKVQTPKSLSHNKYEWNICHAASPEQLGRGRRYVRTSVMLDLVKMALSEIPKYMLHLIGIVVSPHSTVKSLKETDDDHLTRAWIFYGLSILLTEIIISGQRSFLNSPDTAFVSLLIYDAIWKTIIMIVFSLIIFGSLRVVGSRLNLANVLCISMYFYGAINVVGHAFILSYASVKSGIPCERIGATEASYIDLCESAKNFDTFSQSPLGKRCLFVIEWVEHLFLLAFPIWLCTVGLYGQNLTIFQRHDV